MPTRKQLSERWASEFANPWMRSEDDPMYISPAEYLMRQQGFEIYIPDRIIIVDPFRQPYTYQQRIKDAERQIHSNIDLLCERISLENNIDYVARVYYGMTLQQLRARPKFSTSSK